MRVWSHQSISAVFVAVSLLILALATALYWFVRSGETLEFLLSLITVLFAVMAYMYWASMTKSLFDPYSLFLLSMLLFLAGHQLLFVSGLEAEFGGRFAPRFTPAVLDTIAIETLLCFVSLGVGSVISLLVADWRRVQPSFEVNSTANDNALRTVGWSLIAVTAISTALNAAHGIEVVWAQGYSAFMFRQQEFSLAVSINRVLSGFFLPACCLVIAGGRARPREAAAAAALLLLASLPWFFIGERSRAIMAIIVAAWIWSVTIKRIPLTRLLLAGCIILFVVSPTVRAIRNMAGENRNSVTSYANTYFHLRNPITAAVAETGDSGILVDGTVINLVPGKQQYGYGESYLNALRVLLPRGAGKHTFDDSLSEWLVRDVEPVWAKKGGSYGFTFVGEAYYNFGLPGVVIISMGLGAMVAWLTVGALNSRDAMRVALVGVISCSLLFFPRAETVQIARELVWYGIIPWLAALAFRRFLVRKVTGEAG